MKKVKYSETPDIPSPRVAEIGAFEAKTHLSSLLTKVEAGATYLITKRGKPVAEIRPISEAKRGPSLKAGFWKHPVSVAADFNEPIRDFEEYM